MFFITYYSSQFSSNSEADASEILKRREELIPLLYPHGDVFSKTKSSTAQYCVTRRERIKRDTFFMNHVNSITPDTVMDLLRNVVCHILCVETAKLMNSIYIYNIIIWTNKSTKC